MKSARKKERRNKKIKITYLVDFFRTINAGTERQLGHLLTHLPELGYSVRLISLQDSPFLINDAPQLFPRVCIKSLGAQSDISKSLPSLVRLYRLLYASKPDIVHTFFPASNSFGVMIARLTGIRNVISSRRDMGYNLTRKDIALLKIANHFVSCVVTNAKAVQKRTVELESLPTSKTTVIYNGISMDGSGSPLTALSSPSPIVGIVANLNRPVKRVDLFIRSAVMVHKEFLNVRFWVMGDGPLRNDLEQLASHLGLDSSLTFMGRRENIQQLLRSMTVGVICSDSEGLSNSIMEYMNAGLPVVTTNVGGNPELISDGKSGFLVSPNDARSLADATIKLLKSLKVAKSMGKAGKEYIKNHFSIDRMLRQTQTLYESVIF